LELARLAERAAAAEIISAQKAAQENGQSWSTRVRFGDISGARTELQAAWDALKKILSDRLTLLPEVLMQSTFVALEDALEAEAEEAGMKCADELPVVRRSRKAAAEESVVEADQDLNFVLISSDDYSTPEDPDWGPWMQAEPSA